MKVCIIGLGEVGLPTAKYVQTKEFETWGYDKDQTVVKRAIENGFQNATSEWLQIPPADVYVICVSTRVSGTLPDHSSVFDVCEKIFKVPKHVSLVSIESTIIPGTSKRIWQDIFKKRIDLVHVPHRYWPKEPEIHGVNQLRVIGAIDEQSLTVGTDFYNKKLDIPLHRVSSIEAAEICKVSENAYRYVQIAFSEELRMITEELGINFKEVQEACNSKWNITMPEALNGIGGTCLPKDTLYLHSLTSYHDLLEGAVNADAEYKRWLEKLASKSVLSSSKDPKQ